MTSSSASFLEQQQRNWLCWAAVAFGAGIAIYFALSSEPPLLAGPIGIIVGLALAGIGYRRHAALIFGAAIALTSGGFTIAQARAIAVKAPVLSHEIRRTPISGTISAIELLPTGQRITLTEVAIGTQEKLETPDRIRLRVGVPQPELSVGMRVNGRADLSPPQGPAFPGAFDFRRDAYFRGLGAIGFSYGRLNPIASTEKGERDRTEIANGFMLWLSNLRHNIALKMHNGAPSPGSALSVALVVGDQSGIPKADVDAMRDSGLAHILSISGLHIGLAAGLVFFVFRAILALFPAVALRYPIKKWSAMAAIASALFYAMLAGWTTPTERAFIMTALAFAAIILDRSPISLRLLALAAMAVMVAQPESLVGASFQMSFAAVLALIVAFERLGPWLADQRQKVAIGDYSIALPSWMLRAGLWLMTAMASSLVASLATTPFVIVHFNRLALYGVVANAIAVPLTGLWIMPAAVLVLVAIPFGLEEWPLRLMNLGCEALLHIAHSTAAWPGSTMMFPSVDNWALAGSAIGLLTVCLLNGWLRWLGVAPILAAMFSGYGQVPPSVLIASDGQLVGFRSPRGELVLSSARGSEIVRDTWLRSLALTQFGDIDSMDNAANWLHCGVDHCRWFGKATIAIVLAGDLRSPAPCDGADLVVVAQGADRLGCNAKVPVIARAELSTAGGISIFDTENGPIVVPNRPSERRLWSVAESQPFGDQ